MEKRNLKVTKWIGTVPAVAVCTAIGWSGTLIGTALSEGGGRTFGRTRTVPGADAAHQDLASGYSATTSRPWAVSAQITAMQMAMMVMDQKG